MLKIKKQLRKEKNKGKRVISLSIIIMLLMIYILLVLKDQGIFKGWKIYFAYAYIGIIELLLLLNIIKVVSDDKFDMLLQNNKIRIEQGLLKPSISIQLDRIVYIDVSEIKNRDFKILLVIKKGKRHKSLSDFTNEFPRKNDDYKRAYHHLKSMYSDMNFYYYIVKKGGAKKYYYLYIIFKNAYDVEFSERALVLLREFMEEYNLS